MATISPTEQQSEEKTFNGSTVTHGMCLSCHPETPYVGEPLDTLCGLVLAFDVWDNTGLNDCVVCEDIRQCSKCGAWV